MKKYGLPAKMDPQRPWALLLDNDGMAIKGYPLGRGLTSAEVNKWGSSPSTVWIIESELHRYVEPPTPPTTEWIDSYW